MTESEGKKLEAWGHAQYERGLLEAAAIARNHIGKAQKLRRAKGKGAAHFFSDHTIASIRDEERGEDIAAEEIAKAIILAATPIRDHPTNHSPLGRALAGTYEKKASQLRRLPIEERRKAMEAQCTPEMVRHYEVTCPECGLYYPGHATSGQDICTCKDAWQRMEAAIVSSVLYVRCAKHYPVPQQNKNEHSGGECGGCIAWVTPLTPNDYEREQTYAGTNRMGVRNHAVNKRSHSRH